MGTVFSEVFDNGLCGLTDQELIIELARVEQAIPMTQTYVLGGGPTARATTRVSPEMLALAERERDIAAQIALRKMSSSDRAAHRCIDRSGA